MDGINRTETELNNMENSFMTDSLCGAGKMFLNE